MFSAAFAFVVATALALVFKNTRWMGVVAVFVLLAINPLFFTGLLLVAGAGYYLFKRRRSNAVGPTSQTRGNEKGYASRDLLLVLGTVGLGGALALGSLDAPPEISPAKLFGRLRSIASEEVIVLRTPGGLLEVSQLRTAEVIDTRVTHKILGIQVGELVPRIRVPAVYRYHVELAPEWRVLRTDGVFTVVVPPIKPSLPVTRSPRRSGLGIGSAG